VRFAFIAVEKAQFPVRALCATLGVSRAGFYAWQGRPPAPRAEADERLGLEITTIHAESRQRYGSPRIHAELLDRGHHTSRKRVARLMRHHRLAARRRRRYRVTTDSRHPFPVAPNVLARQFEQSAPDVAWVTDITYIPTGEGWLYLAVILDLCSRFVVGWAMSERITRVLTLDALDMALVPAPARCTACSPSCRRRGARPCRACPARPRGRTPPGHRRAGTRSRSPAGLRLRRRAVRARRAGRGSARR
jgi:putative transposase